MRESLVALAIAMAAAFVLPTATRAQEIPTREAVANSIAKTEFSPYAGREYPTNVYWGETHRSDRL